MVLSKFWQNLNGPTFKELFFTVRQYRYDLMFGLHTYKKKNYKSTNAKNFGSGINLPENYTFNHPILYVYVLNSYTLG